MQREEEEKYLSMIDGIIQYGDVKYDRTGVGTFAQFGKQLRFDISDRKLPVVTTRKIKPMDPIIEMLWFIAGDTDIAFLKENNINIWDSWVREETKRYNDEGKLIGGSIGPGAYGAQWRQWEDTRIIDTKQLSYYEIFGYSFVTSLNDVHILNGSKKCVITREIDQLAAAIDAIKRTPDSRRIIVSAWNPGRFEDQALPPCHSLYQFYTYDLSYPQKLKMISTMLEYKQLPEDKLRQLHDFVYPSSTQFQLPDLDSKLNTDEIDEALILFGLPSKGLKLHLFCRSQDTCVGSAYNILQYSALAHIVAQVTNTWATEFIWTASDAHVYSNQTDSFSKQKTNKTLGENIKLVFNPDVKDIDGFKPNDFEVLNYKHHAFIKYPIAV